MKLYLVHSHLKIRSFLFKFFKSVYGYAILSISFENYQFPLTIRTSLLSIFENVFHEKQSQTET